MARRNLGKCPDCGQPNPNGNRRCDCGYFFPILARTVAQKQGTAAAQPARGRSSMFAALIPAILVMGIASAMVLTHGSLSGKTHHPVADEPPSCIETFGLSLHLRESNLHLKGRLPAAGDASVRREPSSLVRGSARNACGEKLRGVRVRVDVEDDHGKRGTAWVKLGTMAAGQAKPFELAWMGRIAKYDAEGIRPDTQACKP